jgi:predicted nucleic acid-binding protein
LIDTSASARMRSSHVARVLGIIIAAGTAATSAVLDAEALHSAVGADEYERVRENRRNAYEYLPTNDEDWQLALDAHRELALTGRHRSVGIADLLTATLAMVHRLTVLHYDADFETAATVLDFEHRWIAPRGSLRL